MSQIKPTAVEVVDESRENSAVSVVDSYKLPKPTNRGMAAFGHPKGGGRKKGTPNKNKIVLFEELEKHKFDVVGEMVNLYNTTQDVNVKLRIVELIARHTMPVPKPVDGNGNADQVIELRYEKYEKDIK